MFHEIVSVKMENILDVKLIIYCVSGIAASFLLLLCLVPVFIKNKRQKGAFIQGAYRSNFAILGVPLAGSFFGPVGSGTAALVLPFAVILFNILAVAVLAMNAENSDNTGIVGKIVSGIIKNPLIIAIALAMPFMFLEISFPPLIKKSMDYIANMSMPLALISLGAGIDLQILKSKVKLSPAASLLRTVLCPVIFVTPAVLLGFRDAALVVIFVLFSAPTAVSSYIMAKNMKSDYELAGQIVALTTVICPVTVFLGSFVLKSLGLI